MMSINTNESLINKTNETFETDYVQRLYKEGKLIVRAMETPSISRYSNEYYYDCSTWANEFELMQRNMFSSVSSTLIIPNVPVKIYKNVGFLVNADIAQCFHISKTDSGSNGNILNNDFNANKADFNKVSELANYIIANNASEMNEININLSIDAVVGLVVTKCQVESELLRKMLFVIKCIEQITGILYPIYEYDAMQGKITKIEMTDELVSKLINISHKHKIFNTTNLLYYTDFDENVYLDNLENIEVNKNSKKI